MPKSRRTRAGKPKRQNGQILSGKPKLRKTLALRMWLISGNAFAAVRSFKPVCAWNVKSWKGC